MTLEDTWYVPCSVTLKEAFEFEKFKNKFKRRGDYLVSLFEGDFVFNDKKMIVRVKRRRPPCGLTRDEQVFSKFQSDSDIIYVLKCAKILGYKFILDEKYSN